MTITDVERGIGGSGNMATGNKKTFASSLTASLLIAAGTAPKQNPNAGNTGRPTIVKYTFRIDITPAMRIAKTKKKRHLLIWKLIFERNFEEFESIYVTRSKSNDIWGLEKDYGPKNKYLNYDMYKSLYNIFPFPKLLPTGSIGIDFNSEILILDSLRDYDTAMKAMQKDQRQIMRRGLKPIVEYLKIYKFKDPDHVKDLNKYIREITTKLQALDDEAMLNLRGARAFSGSHYTFTPQEAIKHLKDFSKQLDQFTKNTQSRLASHVVILDDFRTSKNRIQKWEEGYRIYFDRETLKLNLKDYRLNTLAFGDYPETENMIDTASDVKNAHTDKEEKKIIRKTKELDTYLKRNMIDLKVFEAVPKNFVDNFKNATHQLVQDILSQQIRLLDSEFDLRKKELTYFKNLYAVLENPRNQEYANRHFPIVTFSQFDVFELHGMIAADKSISKTGKAKKFSSDLTRKIGHILVNQKNALETIKNDSSLIWDLDPLFGRAYNEFKMEEKSIYRIIIQTHIRKKAKKKSIKSLILTAVILALSVIPGVGYVGLAAASLVAGKGLVDLYFDVQDHHIARIMKKAGLRSDVPSDWWIILSVVGVYGDVKAFRNIAKNIAGSDGLFLKQVEEARTAGNLRQELLKEKYIDLNDATKNLMVKNSEIINELKDTFNDTREAIKSFFKTHGPRMGMGIPFDHQTVVQLTKIASGLIKLGYTSSDVFIKQVRILFNKKLLDDYEAQLLEIFDTAKKNQKTAVKLLKVSEKAELTPESFKWLEEIGITGEKVKRQLLHHKTSSEIIEAINTFGSKNNNFHQVVKSWFEKGFKQKGARFVTRFGLFLLKFNKVDDIIFEVPFKISRRNPSRIMDIQVPGIKYEIKSVRDVEASLVIWSTSKKKASQFERDLQLLIAQEGVISSNSPLRWIFDKASLPEGYGEPEVIARIQKLLDEGIFRNDKRLPAIKKMVNDIVEVWEVQ
ncbi:MAG: hypothetical protein GQ532_02470 [Methylomarinum sp.]|nr:hypothetical protein [Methylomarinum sp.]